jgi:hypothetical protein
VTVVYKERQEGTFPRDKMACFDAAELVIQVVSNIIFGLEA